jgi:septal ring factor EnvC (AmiA/AmiB activator)
MRIGSFFVALLVALIALGFFISDSMHLRENIDNQQKEIEKLTSSLQKTEQEKQNALAALENSEQEKQSALITLQHKNEELNSCQQRADRSNQLINQLTNENTSLKEQYSLLISSIQSTSLVGGLVEQPQVVQSSAYGLTTFLVLGLGSGLVLWLKHLQKKHNRKGSYVFLTEDEIKALTRQRRAATK